MVNDRDIAIRCAAGQWRRYKAKDMMTFVYCRDNEGFEDAVCIFEGGQVRRLLVPNEAGADGRYGGLGDLSHAIARDISGED